MHVCTYVRRYAKVCGYDSRVARGRDEVEADVDPGVVEGDKITLDLELLLQEVLKLVVDVLHNGTTAAVGTMILEGTENT